ncbi:DUF4301 family protein [bacterium]|nr:DUF4301 family protein [bacterium]
MFSKADRKQIKDHGLDEKEIKRQIELFRRGPQPVNLIRPCVIEDGIVRLHLDQEPAMIQAFSQAADKGRFSKFVPASGAASRMFRDLLALYNTYPGLTMGKLEERANANEAAAVFGLRFIRSLSRFAFYPELVKRLKADDLDVDELLAEGAVHTIIEYLLTDKGLGFASVPKGMVLFHLHGDHAHTAFEEQVLEGIELVSDADGIVRIHFTVPPGTSEKIDVSLKTFIGEVAEEDDFDVELGYSVQKPSTDTISVTPENELFRDDEGKLVFRPGGHGALLDNLNELDADIVLIKNIDNVVPRPAADNKLFRKKVLAGFLVHIQQQVFDYLKEVIKGKSSGAVLTEIAEWTVDTLGAQMPTGWERWKLDKKRDWLVDRLHRPLRVCGMVPNTGEPGGGPFWVTDSSGETTRQIVETSQINTDDPKQQSILEAATHFNPVDLVCGLRDYKGKKFDLSKYRDPETVFISSKSFQGRPLKALELPGLWNGAMAHWNSVFVEVPVHTFTPVKTVNDLLRDEHRV